MPALNWDTDGRDWPNRSASRFVQADGLRWHVQVMGAGPALLLIHGTGASTHSWRDLMPLLAREFSCIALDLPGHAFTSTPSPGQLSLSGMARSVAQLIAALQIEPKLIVGHSAGAAVAAQLCLRERIPAMSIVSLNGAFFPLAGVPGLLFPPAARVMASTPLASRLFAWRAADRLVVRRLIEQTGSRLDLRGEELYARLVSNAVHVAAALGMMARWDVGGLAGALPQLRQRLHLLAGATDRAVLPGQSRRVRAMVDDARRTQIDGAGHLLHEEKPFEVAELIVACKRSLVDEEAAAA